MRRAAPFIALLLAGCGRTEPRLLRDSLARIGAGAVEGGLEARSIPAPRTKLTIGMRFRAASQEGLVFFSKGDAVLVDGPINFGRAQVRARFDEVTCSTNFGAFATGISTSLVVMFDAAEHICRIYVDGADATISRTGQWPSMFQEELEEWRVGESKGVPLIVDDVFVDLDSVWTSRMVWSWHGDRSIAPMPASIDVDSWCRGLPQPGRHDLCMDASGNGRHWNLLAGAAHVREVHEKRTPATSAPFGLQRQDVVFLGQSNGSGRGRLEELGSQVDRFRRLERIFVYSNDGRIENPAREPWDDPAGQREVYPVSEDEAVGVGPALAFADRVLDGLSGRELGLLPCTKGGTHVAGIGADNWMPGSDQPMRLFGECEKRIREQLMGELAGLVIYQGESEAASAYDAENVGYRWTGVINALRDSLGRPDLPAVFVVPPVSPTVGDRFAYWRTMRSSLAGICSQLTHCRTVEAPDGPWDDPSRAHLATAAQLELGPRIADAMMSTEYWQLLQGR